MTLLEVDHAANIIRQSVNPEANIIFGSLIALAIFSFYSYFQINDRTTLYYGLWLVTAMGVVIGQGTHDGTRLFEFIMRPFDENPFFDTGFPTTVAGITGYSQAMMFVIFARQFINLKQYYPVAFQLTNLYLIWYASHFFVVTMPLRDISLVWY